jgi:hypothetical protein
MSLPLALTLCVGASQKSGQVLVRTYVLKHAEFPKVYWGMSGVLKLDITRLSSGTHILYVYGKK